MLRDTSSSASCSTWTRSAWSGSPALGGGKATLGIRAGKRADFTVLAEDPYDTEPELLKDIPVLGTIFEGTVFEQDS